MGRREAFDPLRTYVANKTFAFGPKTFKEGEAFNDRTDMRRFRQLYDSRYLRMASEDEGGAPSFQTMTETQLREWLVNSGNPMLAHARTPHTRLVERCRRVWQQQQLAPKPAAQVKNGDGDGVAVGRVRAQSSRTRVSRAAAAGRAASRDSGERQRIR